MKKSKAVTRVAALHVGFAIRSAMTLAFILEGLTACSEQLANPTGPVVTCEFRSGPEACSRAPQDPM